MLIRQPPDEEVTPAPVGGRTTSALVQIGRYGPIAAGYAVFQSLVGVLPPTLSANTARYALAACAGLSVGVITWLSALLIRRRTERTERTAREGAESRSAGASQPDVSADAGRMGQVMDGAAEALVHCRSEVDHPDVGRLVGWPHFLEEGEAGQQATAVSTAYGLHIALLLNRDNGLLDSPALVDTLWRLRKPDGGWAARTGGGVSRPEVTALVVGALSQAGADPVRLRDALDTLEGMLVPGTDPQGMSSTYIVAAVVRGLLRAAPHAPVLRRLQGELVAGASRDADHGGLLCWGHSLDAPGGPRRPGPPSVAHTAHAVIALSRLERVLGADNHARQAVEQGAEWLVERGTLRHQTEHLRRLDPVHGNADIVVVRHFTAALVAKALLSAPVPDPAGAAAPTPAHARRRAHLVTAIGRVWESQQEGVWEWHEDRERRPVWMTYQGLSVLNAHALASYQGHAEGQSHGQGQGQGQSHGQGQGQNQNQNQNPGQSLR